jgi:hypothetical protein
MIRFSGVTIKPSPLVPEYVDAVLGANDGNCGKLNVATVVDPTVRV